MMAQMLFRLVAMVWVGAVMGGALQDAAEVALVPSEHGRALQLVAPTAVDKGAVCNACVQLSGQSLNILLNYVLNAGVVGGCSKLCGALKAGKDVTLACDIVCDVVGIKEFIKVLNSTDLDPIYFCEVLHVCPAGPDNAAAEITAVSVDPASGPVGSEFDFLLAFNVLNETGVGEVRIGIEGPGQSIGQGFLNTGFAPGAQQMGVKLQVKDDPSAEPPVIWSPGTYMYEFELCQGECNSKHPHSIVFGKKGGNFTISPGGTPLPQRAAVTATKAPRTLILDPEYVAARTVQDGTHYGDPSAGCEADEVAVQIQGITGDFCTSKCSLFKACPTDVPANVTATPQCALTDASSGSKYCALICDPSGSNTCGTATCKSISGTGLCTYDD